MEATYSNNRPEYEADKKTINQEAAPNYPYNYSFASKSSIFENKSQNGNGPTITETKSNQFDVSKQVYPRVR
jgi:hypothetical protein